MKCRWHTYGWGTWHTTLDSDVSGVYIALDKLHKDFSVVRVVPLPGENERIAGYPDLKTAKAAAKKYFIEHLALASDNLSGIT